ncbi:MAG: hypothetical protein U1E65_11640 [Myxococcota bacterium]
MKPKAILLSLTLLAPSAAGARTFSIDYGNAVPVDPAAGFDTDCWGEVEAPDCSARAALIETALLENLDALSGRADPATRAVFEAAVSLESPDVRAVALRYFAAVGAPPTSLSAKIHDFFFGPDSDVGYPAAEVYARSTEDTERELARRYQEGRASPNYTGAAPSTVGLDDAWAIGFVQDRLWDQMTSFSPDEIFQPASRLLMLDRMTVDLFADPTDQIPVTSFVTDAPLAEVTAHFTTLFGGPPNEALSAARAHTEALQAELMPLEARAIAGDTAAIARLREVSEQLQAAQQAQLIGERLGLEGLGCLDQIYWNAAPAANAATGPSLRAVVVGTDPGLGRTVIRYINGQGTTGAVGMPGGGGPSGGDPSPSPSPAAGKAGCSCTRPSPTLGLGPALLFAALLWRGGRRSRKR